MPRRGTTVSPVPSGLNAIDDGGKRVAVGAEYATSEDDSYISSVGTWKMCFLCAVPTGRFTLSSTREGTRGI